MAPSNTAGNGVQRVLNAILSLKLQFNLEEAPKKRVAALAEVSGSTFPSLISRMVKKGLIVYGSTPSTISLTAEGERIAEPVEVQCTNEGALNAIKKKLKGKALLICEHLEDGEAHSKEEVMEAIQCTNPKTFRPLLSRELKKYGYIEYVGKSMIQLSDECFPFGRQGDKFDEE